ncbi:peptidase [Peribacillus sp. NPDC097264]|uniref:peptidase n=1 Tax=Peribacillus sp. NPDC097264 TaxID=3390616 RepID=UPI003CFFA255
MKSIVLDEIKVNNNRVDYYFTPTKKLQKYFKANNNLFIEYNHELCDIPESILTIPFLSNVIPLIWITNSKIQVNELDKSFYDCLASLKKSYQIMFPNMDFQGEIIVGKVVENSYEPIHEVASLFSGGLDAITTFIRVKDKKPILITEFGWHESEIKNSDVWDADKENAVEFAKNYGLDNILLQSNYGNFINPRNIDKDFSKRLGDTWWHGLHHSLAIISAAIPLAFKLKVECIYIASSHSIGLEIPCASDPTTDNKIRFASGRVFHDGFELTRQAKTKVVVDYFSTIKETTKIRVCFKNEENCCNCEKCLRTILGIVAEGKNPKDFGFNIPDDFSAHIENFLFNNIKFFTKTNIMFWNIIKQRFKENKNNIPSKFMLEWFLIYDFATERKYSLIKYRVIKFFPILKRKISAKIFRNFESGY